MPRIPERLLDAVFYLYGSKPAAESGDEEGGTGFFLSVPQDFSEHRNDFVTARALVANERQSGLVYAVTNEHVISDGFIWAKVNTPEGSTVPFKLPASHWVMHPDGDDLAVCPVGLSRDLHKYHAVPARMLVLPETFERSYIKVGPGDDVFYIGRFLTREGTSRNTPTVRFGNIAMMPHEPIPRGKDS